jgi:hypothetical protein
MTQVPTRRAENLPALDLATAINFISVAEKIRLVHGATNGVVS